MPGLPISTLAGPQFKGRKKNKKKRKKASLPPPFSIATKGGRSSSKKKKKKDNGVFVFHPPWPVQKEGREKKKKKGILIDRVQIKKRKGSPRKKKGVAQPFPHAVSPWEKGGKR